MESTLELAVMEADTFVCFYQLLGKSIAGNGFSTDKTRHTKQARKCYQAFYFAFFVAYCFKNKSKY